MSTWFSPSLASFGNVLVASVAIRVGLVLYSEWHDAHSVVKYTDVDYRVFTDAAAFLIQHREGDTTSGPLVQFLPEQLRASIGSPYTRETYRYTPLLAALLTPNIWLHPSFGKYLFALCDILNGLLIYRLLKTEILPSLLEKRDKTNSSQLSENDRLATIYAAVHLLNPLVFSISTRGSSESVLSLFVLLTLYAALKNRWDASALFLGLSTHWKIYPLIYGVSCVAVLGGLSQANGFAGSIRALLNLKTIRFALISAGTFVLLGVFCYAFWGYSFLYESYLYHLHRLDHRHNFSPYFYLTYLTYPWFEGGEHVQEAQPVWMTILQSPLASFVPQMGLALGLGLLFGRTKEDLPFAWFVQTVVFVIFNKVCTSQYFLWYLLLLPLLLPRLSPSRGRATAWVVIWVAAQALWLSEAYRLEFLGEPVFLSLWVRGLVYVIANCWVLVDMIGVVYK